MAFIHAKDQKSRDEGWFEVIAGKSMLEEGVPKCFAYVQSYDTKPKRRLFELMKSQGLQANQQVTFLSDGADDVRELPLYLSPESEHWLDWFHVAMRLRVMGQMAKGLLNEQNMMSAQEPLTEPGEELDTVDIGKQLERVKWFLWHGDVGRALDTIDDVEAELDLLPVRHLPPELRAKTTFPGDQLLHGFPPALVATVQSFRGTPLQSPTR